MLPRTPVFIVASPRPRVGKTLLSRALSEYFRAEDRVLAAFDVNPDEFSLADYLPAYTAVATVGDTRGQMALFDRLVLPDRVPKVIDLGHALFERFFAVMLQIDFAREARRNLVLPVVLFVADGDPRTRAAFATLNERLGGLPVLPVVNEAVPIAARYRNDFVPASPLGGPLIVPSLAPVIRSVIERPGFSFVGYRTDPSTDPTSELYQWTQQVFVAFRELERRLMTHAPRAALRHST